MDDETDKFYKELSDEVLRSRLEQYPATSPDYMNALTETLRREKIKEEENKKEQAEIKNDQRQIKYMTAVILVLTVILLGYAVAQYFK